MYKLVGSLLTTVCKKGNVQYIAMARDTNWRRAYRQAFPLKVVDPTTGLPVETAGVGAAPVSSNMATPNPSQALLGGASPQQPVTVWATPTGMTH